MKFQFKYLFIVFCFVLISCKSRESRRFNEQGLAKQTHLENKKQKEKVNYNDSIIVIPNLFSGRVTGIIDGDTYDVLYKGAERRIRLAHIDCPEKKQPFGTKAKLFASNLCFGEMVTVKIQGKPDRNGRLIAEIITEQGVNINKELVKNGLAWHYKAYSDNIEYAQLEIEAKKGKMAIWSEANPIEPWRWRKSPKQFQTPNSKKE